MKASRHVTVLTNESKDKPERSGKDLQQAVSQVRVEHEVQVKLPLHMP